jgi:hypothetical protein
LDGKAKTKIFGRIFESLLNGKKVLLGNYPVMVGNSESFQVVQKTTIKVHKKPKCQNSCHVKCGWMRINMLTAIGILK